MLKKSNTETEIFINLFNCKDCNSDLVTTSFLKEIPGCKTIQCNKCANIWYICESHKLRFPSRRFTKCKKHFNTFHKCISTAPSLYKNEVNFQLNETGYDTDTSSTSNNMTSLGETDHLCTEIESVSSKKEEIIKNLICSSFAQDFKSSSIIDKSECQFHLQTTKFCLGLTESQQNQFASLLHQVTTINFQKTRLPLDFNDIRKFYTAYKYSIYENIPCPKSFTYDSHACISLVSVVEKALLLGLPLDLIQSSEYKNRKVDNSSILNVPYFVEVLEKVYHKYNTMGIDPFVFMLVIWSDSFEPNNTRQNKQSIWLKTVTVCTSLSCDTSASHTFALCMGFKKDSHDGVNTMYNNELISLQNIHYFYIDQLAETKPCVFHVMVMSNDRPERCAINNLLQYGTSTKRFGFCALTNPNKVASCSKCYFNHMLNIQIDDVSLYKSNSRCRVCCDYEFGLQKTVEQFDVPADYPRILHANSPEPPLSHPIFKPRQARKLHPYKQNYTSLKQAITFAIYNIQRKSWKPNEGISYLKMVGLSGNTISNILEFSLNADNNDKSDNICSYDKFHFPCMWTSSLDIDQFIEVPMHHIFEGIIKSIIDIQTTYFKWNKKWSSFANDSNIFLNSVSSVRSSFCKALPFSGENYTTGGWIAEQYIAYARIMVVLMNNFDKYIDEKSLGYTEMIVLIQSSHTLVAHLMSKDEIETSKIRELIKFFLGTCHYYEKKIGYAQNYPIWYRKSNFFSLMNLPDQIEKFGPLRLHWEGEQEKFIQYMKPMLTNLRVNETYLSSKLQQRSQNSFFDLLMNKDHGSKVNNNERIFASCSYKSLSMIKDKVMKNESLKGLLIFRENTVYTLFNGKDEWCFCEISFSDDNGIHRCGQFYAEIDCDSITASKCFQSMSDIIHEDINELILIPLYPNTTNKPKMFTVIGDHWKKRDNKGYFNLPKISTTAMEAMYKNI